MDFEIFGNLKEDFAINLQFEDLNESFWFTEELIEHLHNGEGTEITLDGIDKKWTKGENGEWIEQDTNPTRDKNKAEQNQSKNKD